MHKALEWICRQIMRKKGVAEHYTRLLSQMYKEAETQVKSKKELSDNVKVKAGEHQITTLHPSLFVTLLDAITNAKERKLQKVSIRKTELVVFNLTKRVAEHMRLTLKQEKIKRINRF